MGGGGARRRRRQRRGRPALATDARRDDNKNSDVQEDPACRGWRVSVGNEGEEEGEGSKGDGDSDGNGNGRRRGWRERG